jgi:hypothetical protein
MADKTRYEDESLSIKGRSHGGGIRHFKEYGGYDEGYVVTPNGIVGVYAQRGETKRDYYTCLTFALDGRQYSRVYRRHYLTHRGLVTASTRFAREIVEAQA